MQNSKNSKYFDVTEKFNMEVMTNYNNHIFGVALNNFNNVKKCIDFGAGIGTLALILRNKYCMSQFVLRLTKKTSLSQKSLNSLNI